MFGIGWPEFLIIAVLAVILIGPKDLPQALFSLGKLVRKISMATRAFQRSFEEVMREAELQEIEKDANAIMGRDVDEVLKERGLDQDPKEDDK